MKKNAEWHLLLDWRNTLLGIAAELAYPVALGLVVLFMAWMLVKLT
ncbi:MAG: hypothetical protein ACYC5Y_07015 [Symbiobacteriia bacterium]